MKFKEMFTEAKAEPTKSSWPKYKITYVEGSGFNYKDYSKLFKANIQGSGVDMHGSAIYSAPYETNKYIVISEGSTDNVWGVIAPATNDTINGSKKFTVFEGNYDDVLKHENLSFAAVNKIVKALMSYGSNIYYSLAE